MRSYWIAQRIEIVIVGANDVPLSSSLRDEKYTGMSTQNRYLAIDGLRGLAALSVAVYHLSGNLKVELGSWMPELVMTIFEHGYLGVPVFFVLSGFVIAHSIGDAEVTPRYIGNFALRRSIRLDPTYWVSIVVTLTLLYGKNLFLPAEAAPFPSIGNVVAHTFYLQDILSFPPLISAVYWTLCLEIQLYLFFILTMGFKSSVYKWFKVNNLHIPFIFMIGIYSLLLDYQVSTLEMPGLFLPYWHYFLMGVLTSMALRNQAYSRTLLLSWVILEILFQIIFAFKIYAFAGVTAGIFIFSVGAAGAMSSVLASSMLQYLGCISYTLYLVHADIGWKFISVGKKLIGPEISPFASLSLLVSGLVVSIIAAHILHVLIEKPSLRFAARFKLRQQEEVVPQAKSRALS